MLRAGAVSGVLAVAVAVMGLPAHARADTACRDDDGWWCLYGRSGLEDGGGLIATNNPDTDLKMDGDWSFFNDATRSVSNRTDSYVGLYDDIEFQGLMACLPPGTWAPAIDSGVSSLRIHPGRGEACDGENDGSEPQVLKIDPEPPPTERPKDADAGKTPTEPRKKPEHTEKPTPTASPSLNLPPLVAPGSRPAPNGGAATEPAAAKDDGAPVAIAAALAAFLALAGLGVGGRLFGRRRSGAVPVPRTATDPGAAHRVHRALLLLVDVCERNGRDVPAARAATIDAAEVTLYLATVDMAAPPPWRAAPGGRRWSLFVAEIGGLVDAAGLDAPYPLMAMIRPGMWVNLAAYPAPIALTGNRNSARKAAVGLAQRLRESPWHGGVRVRTVGFGPDAPVGPETPPEPEEGTERGRVVFINDGMQVPGKVPPGSAVVSVGRPDGAGTTWRVRFDGSVVPPPELRVKGRAPEPSGTYGDSDSSDSSDSSDASAGADFGGGEG
jgi:hypothetical protein